MPASEYASVACLQAIMLNVYATICPPDRDIAAHWSALIQRACANVFMCPTALLAAYATGFADIEMLLAWTQGEQPERLVGVWGLRRASIAPLWPSFLEAPPYNYAFLSNPVVDPDVADEVIAAFFDAIEREHSLPKVLRLRYLDGSADTYPAIMHALAARGAQTTMLSERERPYVTKEFGIKRSGSTRKKLRQDWNRLGAIGAVDIVNARSRADVQNAFETFLAMEAASWKGARGTALLNDENDATFVRRLIADLAAEENASVALLRVDGRAIAAQVLLYCGATAYTWKTAFDAEFGKFSPGALLVDKISEQLFADSGITAIESCSPDGGFMNQIWDGRRTTVDMLADLGPKKSLEFHAMVARERSYAQLRAWRNRLRDLSWPALGPRKHTATSR
jgi:CelD/BcsL family acetyltransferase involved in cellulose biosynthesis